MAEITRKWSMPNKKTFKIQPIRELIISEMVEGLVIDPFANESSIKSYMSDGTLYVSNDIDKTYNTDYHMDALNFLKLFPDNSVDMVLYDPPYSPRQVSECYKAMEMSVNMQTTQSSYWGNQKKEIARIVKTGGKVITFGWNSGGIGSTNGFEKTKILMVAHGGWHNDTICTVEQKKE